MVLRQLWRFREGICPRWNHLVIQHSRRSLVTSPEINDAPGSPELLRHGGFIDTTKEEGSDYLGLFVGQYSVWRARGLPWKLYKPWNWGIGQEIGEMEALERLSNNEPVRFQRMRVVTVTPDLKALEQLAVPAVARLGKVAEKSKVAADPQGWEIRNGIPTTIHSLAELKLFTSIYIEELKLPQQVINQGNKDNKFNKIINEQITIANQISDLTKRKLESGLEFFTNEDKVSRRFLYYLQRQVSFWGPLGLVAAYALASPSVMNIVGIEPYFFLPPALLQDIPSIVPESLEIKLDSEIKEIPMVESSAGICAAALATLVPIRSLWLSLTTPLGFRLTAYEAFCRIARGEPTVFQEVKMHTLRVPFLTTLSWFTNYRPGNKITSTEELVRFHRMHLMKVDSLKEQ